MKKYLILVLLIILTGCMDSIRESYTTNMGKVKLIKTVKSTNTHLHDNITLIICDSGKVFIDDYISDIIPANQSAKLITVLRNSNVIEQVININGNSYKVICNFRSNNNEK